MNKTIRLCKSIGIFLLNVTWCALQTFVGALIAIALLFVSKVTKYRGMVILYHKFAFTFSLGTFAFISSGAPAIARPHLYGHFLQSCVLGPFYLFTVTISQLIVRIPSLKRRRLERGKTTEDCLAETTAAALAARAREMK